MILPEGLTSIGVHCFDYCRNRKEINIPSTLTSIGRGAFGSCYSIEQFTIPQGTKTLSYGLFSDCEGLKTVVIPRSVTLIEEMTFDACESLSDIYYQGTEDEWNNIIIEDYNVGYINKATIHYGAGYITVSDCENGSISVDKAYGEKGEIVTVTAVADQCYKLENILIDGIAISGNSFTVNGDHTVSATFAENHENIVVDPAEEPTCIETGLTEGRHCSVCDKVIVQQQVIDALGHTKGTSVEENRVEPTVTKEGSYDKVVYCKVCQATISRETIVIPATGLTENLTEPVVKVTNVASTGKIRLTWDAVDYADRYEVYRSKSKSGTYSRMYTTTGTSYTDTSAVTGTIYYYKVKAIYDADSSKNSGFSNIVSRTCDLPQTKVTAINVTSTGKIKLSWTAVDGAKEYKVYRATSKDGTYSLLKTTTGTTLTNTSVTAGKTYYYKVHAIHTNSAANSAYSEIVSRTCDLPRTTVTATNVTSTGKINLSWTAVDGAKEYNVYCATSKDGTYNLLGTTTDATFTDTFATAGTTYYYKVRAIHANFAANSAYSLIVSRICDLPQTKVTASNVTSTGKIKLSWTAVDGAKEYNVYCATRKDGTYNLLGTTTDTTFTDTSATAGTTYYYKVRAIHTKSAANSAYSSIVSRTCDLLRPAVSVSLNSKGKPALKWNAVSGAVKYEVYRSKSKSGTYTKMYTTTGTNYTNTGAVSGTTYYYKVCAVHSVSAANSAYSLIVSATSK